MKDAVIIKKGEYISKAERESCMLGMLATINHVEISELTLKKDKQLILVPGKEFSVTEFIYMLEGELHESTGKHKLHVGDSMYVKDIEQTLYYDVIENTRVLYFTHESIVQDMSEVIKELNIMISQLEKKDHYTKEHSIRVVDWVPQLSRKLSLDDDQVRVLVNAALFHDVGKLEIADQILMKPGKLTEEEYDRIKRHPSLGRIIAEEHGLMEEAIVIEQHHERVDGKGYPRALTGDQIRLEAKIISVIDSFDAMTSNRPYRSGLSEAEAVEELLKDSGKAYDPEVLDAFLSILGPEE